MYQVKRVFHNYFIGDDTSTMAMCTNMENAELICNALNQRKPSTAPEQPDMRDKRRKELDAIAMEEPAAPLAMKEMEEGGYCKCGNFIAFPESAHLEKCPEEKACPHWALASDGIHHHVLTHRCMNPKCEQWLKSREGGEMKGKES